MCCFGKIVLIGSVITYLAAGYMLKPVQKLSGEIKKRNINNFAEPLNVPQSYDEIQELTVSFNRKLLIQIFPLIPEKHFTKNLFRI